ncbi:MAG TPA: hypothetical protein VMW67_04700 [Desulfobacteria bacterium]|nr:hypothetical protein [Desulfobacteria bacterium]
MGDENRLALQTLEDFYGSLTTRHKLYLKATRFGNILGGLGVLVSLISLLLVAFHPPTRNLSIGAFAFGFILAYIGDTVIKRSLAPPKLSRTEKEFLNVFAARKDLDDYFKKKIDFVKIEAAKKISKFEKHLYNPSSNSTNLWVELIKDRNDSLDILRKNLNERLIPSIKRGDDEEIEKAYNIITKVSQYLQNPEDLNILFDLNDLMLKLPTYTEEESIRSSLFDRYPNFRHIFNLFFFAVFSFFVYYIGVNFSYVSLDTAYTVAILAFVGLTAAYMTNVIKGLK